MYNINCELPVFLLKVITISRFSKAIEQFTVYLFPNHLVPLIPKDSDFQVGTVSSAFKADHFISMEGCNVYGRICIRGFSLSIEGMGQFACISAALKSKRPRNFGPRLYYCWIDSTTLRS